MLTLDKTLVVTNSVSATSTDTIVIKQTSNIDWRSDTIAVGVDGAIKICVWPDTFSRTSNMALLRNVLPPAELRQHVGDYLTMRTIPLANPTHSVVCVSLSQNGKRVASCGYDGYVHVFDAASGERVASAEHGGDEVNGVCFSPDGRRVASCGKDGYVRVFDAASGRQVASAAHGGEVNGVCFSPDGRHVASCGNYGYVRVFKFSTEQEVTAGVDGGGAGNELSVDLHVEFI